MASASLATDLLVDEEAQSSGRLAKHPEAVRGFAGRRRAAAEVVEVVDELPHTLPWQYPKQSFGQ